MNIAAQPLATEASTIVESPLLDRREATAYLKIGVSTLKMLERQGRVRVRRIGKRAVYKRDDLDAYIASL